MAVRTELINGGTLRRTWSDLKVYIKQTSTGNLYSEAVDPMSSTEEYAETDKPVPDESNVDNTVTI